MTTPDMEFFAIRVPGGYMSTASGMMGEIFIHAHPRNAHPFKTLDEARAAANGCPVVRVVVMVEECAGG